MLLTSKELVNQTQYKALQTLDFIVNLCWTNCKQRELVLTKDSLSS